MKKILAIALAALLFVSLTACGGGDTGSTPTDSQPASTPASTPDSTPASDQDTGEFNLPGNYDFGGEEILIKTFGGYGSQKPGASVQGDMEIRWKAEVEKKYHCEILTETLIPNDTQNSLVVRLLAGDKIADVIACHRLDVEKMRISGNLLKDLAGDEIKNLGLDLTDPRWNAQLTDALTFNGKTYGTFPVRADIEICMFFNVDLLEQLGLESPYNYVMSKEWTFDKLLADCQVARQKGYYGCMFTGDALWTMMYNNGGARLISKNADGTMTYTGYNPQNVATLTWLKDNFYNAKLVPEEMGILDLHTMFKEGKLLFITGPDSYLVTEAQWGSCDFEVGFLPLPIGPNGDDYSFVLHQWPPCFCISATNDNPEKGVAFMNAYLAYEDAVNPLREASYENDWFGNDEQGYEVFQMLRNKAYYDWAIYDLGFFDIIYQPTAVFLHPDASIEATMQADATRFQKMVDDIYNMHYTP